MQKVDPSEVIKLLKNFKGQLRIEVSGYRAWRAYLGGYGVSMRGDSITFVRGGTDWENLDRGPSAIKSEPPFLIVLPFSRIGVEVDNPKSPRRIEINVWGGVVRGKDKKVIPHKIDFGPNGKLRKCKGWPYYFVLIA